jgi:signal peptidase I
MCHCWLRLGLVGIGRGRIKMKEAQNNWKPKRWLATLLSLFVGCSGMLYLGRGKLYLIYLLATLLTAIAAFITFDLLMTDLQSLFSLTSFIINITCAIHTYKLSTSFKQNYVRPWYSYWWGILAVYLIIIIPTLLFRSFFYEPFHIPARSMAPTYEKGDYIVISKLGYGNYGSFGINLINTKPSKKIQHGDVIVFSYPPNPKIDYIKRVIGLPGDVVSYKSKKLLINNKAISIKFIGDYKQLDDQFREILFKEYEESLSGVTWHIINLPEISSKDFEATTPPDSYFVMGDNRDNSADSRFWGFVPSKYIKGKVIYSTGGKR